MCRVKIFGLVPFLLITILLSKTANAATLFSIPIENIYKKLKNFQIITEKRKPDHKKNLDIEKTLKQNEKQSAIVQKEPQEENTKAIKNNIHNIKENKQYKRHIIQKKGKITSKDDVDHYEELKEPIQESFKKTHNKEDYYTFEENQVIQKKPEDVDSSDKKITDELDEIRLKIGGAIDARYYHMEQNNPYSNHLLPNQQLISPAINNGESKVGRADIINLRSVIYINPEFINHKLKMKAGAFMAIPITLNELDRNIDPRIASQEYMYFDMPYYRIEFGSTFSSVAKMRVDPSRIASGTGGVYGAWWNYVHWPVYNTANMPNNDAIALNYGFSPTFIIYPTLPNEAGFTHQRYLVGNVTSNNFVNKDINYNNLAYSSSGQAYPTQGARSNKISFYTKRIYGIQFGYSYSPTTDDSGVMTRSMSIGGYNNISGGFVKDLMTFALNYKKQFEDFGIAASITHEIGRPYGSHFTFASDSNGQQVIDLGGNPYFKRHNLNATAYGFQLTYKNFAIAYSYGDWRDSLLLQYSKNPYGPYVLNHGNRSYFHTAGASFNFGPITLASNYMRSNFAGNKMDVWSIGSDFKMISIKYAKIQPYIEYTMFHFMPDSVLLNKDSSQSYKAIANKGYVILTGVRLTF
jgi:hypothetical protein